jgi:hypothetical protein
MFYAKDTVTRKQVSLRTKDEPQPISICILKNVSSVLIIAVTTFICCS